MPRISGEGQNQVGIDRVLGQQAVVLEEVNPLHARGMVRVAREEWRADSLDGQVIPRGSIVDVVRVEGTRLIVRPTPMRTLSEEKE
ncbi:MAG: NfeD family protein [Anaerolineales bacterium]|nr:NfeD family protein [Anaerolineales bacterium]